MKVKNFSRFQHYHDRRPPWIKLHRELLDDISYIRLPLASRALAPCLWLLASENNDASIKLSVEDISFRLRLDRSEVTAGLQGLISQGFILIEDDDASDVLALGKQTLATCQQIGVLEERRDRDREEKRESKKRTSNFKTWTEEEFREEILKSNEPTILFPDEVEQFVGYWLEPTASGQPRRALEKTWDTKRRMENAVRMVFQQKRDRLPLADGAEDVERELREKGLLR